jgi:hypothetical protein
VVRASATLTLLAVSFIASCSSTVTTGTQAPASEPKPDAPVVNAEPGAWFDARGNLTIVGAGKRLRLVLSAPIAACGPALERGAGDADAVANASLPFHVLSDACRSAHPAILLAEEGETASRAELEHSYHEVARCAATDYGLTDGWIPKLVAQSDPCPLALGLGWRLPTSEELLGLTLDDRKAVAGALFDAEDRGTGGTLLLYARSQAGELSLVTLSPNAAERPPRIEEDKRAQPLFGVALRCVNDASPPNLRTPPPVLPRAADCLREKRHAEAGLASGPSRQPAPEVQKLRQWLEAAERTPTIAQDQRLLGQLSALLAPPTLDEIAREARAMRALTERYAELAEGLDEPGASQAEQGRRRAEFENLRRRLGGQIVSSAESAGVDGSALPAIVSRLLALVESAEKAKPPKKTHADYGPVLARLRALNGTVRP